MKKLLSVLALTAGLTFAAVPLFAQMGSAGATPMGDALNKVFGTNLNFSADMQTEVTTPQNQTISMAGKIYMTGGNARTEMDMTKITGGSIPPQAITQMKTMGMDKLVSISIGSKKMLYLIYPNMQAYAKITIPGGDSSGTSDFKVDSVDLGKDTVDGHPCEKMQYTVSNAKTGEQLKLITWNATDLKGIPIQMKQMVPANNGNPETAVTTHFNDVNVSTPSASLFLPPDGYTAYDSLQTMLQTEAMKKMGGTPGMPAK
jgi:hypothetical protein